MGVKQELIQAGNRESRESVNRYSRIFDTAPLHEYADGITLFKQGSPTQDVYRLETGLVKILFSDRSGGEVIIQLCSDAGAVFGDVCAILGKHSISACVVTRNTQLRRVSANVFTDLVSHDTEMSWSLHQDHCRILRDQIERAAQLGYLSVRQRIENLLWRLAGICESIPTEKGLRVQLPLKYREMAQLVAVTPEHLCRVLGTLEDEQLIARDKGWLYLKNRGELWHLANESAEKSKGI